MSAEDRLRRAGFRRARYHGHQQPVADQHGSVQQRHVKPPAQIAAPELQPPTTAPPPPTATTALQADAGRGRQRVVLRSGYNQTVHMHVSPHTDHKTVRDYRRRGQTQQWWQTVHDDNRVDK